MCQKIIVPFLGIPLFAYGFMILAGFLTASYLARREAGRRGLPKEKILDFAVVFVLAGVIGARVFFVVQFYEEQFSQVPWYEIFAIWEGGLVFYGGVVGGALGGIGYLWWNGLPILKVLDTCAPFVPVGMGFGRIGCWLNGCCWGKRCVDFLPPFLNRFPPGSPVHSSQLGSSVIREGERTLPVHPTQLYDSVHSFLIFGMLWYFLRKGSAQGVTTCMFFVMYGLGRFVVEFLRGDPKITATGLTVAQNLSILAVGAGIAGIVALAARAGGAQAAQGGGTGR